MNESSALNDFSGDSRQIVSSKSRRDFTSITTHWREPLEGPHRPPARWAVSLILEFPIRKPKEKHAAMFYKFFGTGMLFKLLLKFLQFGLDLTILFSKSFVFGLDFCQLVAKKKQSLLENRRASVLVDQVIEK